MSENREVWHEENVIEQRFMTSKECQRTEKYDVKRMSENKEV